MIMQVNQRNTIVIATSAIVAVSSVICILVVSLLKQRSSLQVQQQESNGGSIIKEELTTTLAAEAPVDNSKKEEEVSEDYFKTTQVVVPRTRILCPGTITVAFTSTTGTCESLAQGVVKSLTQQLLTTATSSDDTCKYSHVQICQISHVDWWDELLNNDEQEHQNSNTTTTHSSSMVILIVPTWTDGSFPPGALSLQVALQEISTDWRVAPKCLSNKMFSFAIFGMGSTAYDTMTFNRPAKTIVSIMRNKLGAKLIGPVGLGDDSVGDFRQDFQLWFNHVQQQITGTNQVIQNDDVLVVAAAKSKQQHKRLVVRGKKPKPKEVDPITTTTTTTTCCSTADHETNTSSGCCQSNNHTNAILVTYPLTTTTTTTTCCSTGHDADTSNSCCQSNNDNNDILVTDLVAPKEEEESKEVLFDDDDEDDNDSSSAYESSEEEEDDDPDHEPDVMDLEDLGAAMKPSSTEPKEMVTPKQAAALKKEGYKLIGTHSAVKLCRWTKHQLRGRGGCYKHTFYGITSYQCMEATPSLACANKCVFCWRHHKNPVGKEWRWKMDDPHFIVAEAVLAHVSLIKEARGIPGVLPQRYQEALTVRHCALSLVGEPIMYPRINEFLGDLHSRNISTFLVTNGQHPAAIDTLIPVTQLYVSVDAPTEQTLIEIDRPLFKDAWDRLRLSLSLLKHKRQRTVARLTVVKGWNSNEITGYAELIALGHVSLVEVKGVTFCGKSDASNLNMSNSPWHHEVVALTLNLQQELAKMTAAGGPDAPPLYGIACEHKHSCCIVLARVDQFAVDDPVTGTRKWRTWIDFEKFLELGRRHEQDPTFTFGVEDYIADTPPWATYGSEEEGFDPTDRRYRKKGKAPLYTKYDSRGVPTHGWDGSPLSTDEVERLNKAMDCKIADMGTSLSVVMELEDGAKAILDPSLMFRGLVVSS